MADVPTSRDRAGSVGKQALKTQVASVGDKTGHTARLTAPGPIESRSGSLARRTTTPGTATKPAKFQALLDVEVHGDERTGRESASPGARRRSLSPFGRERSGSGSGKKSRLRKAHTLDSYSWMPRSPEVRRRNKTFAWLLKQPKIVEVFGKELTAAHKAVWLGTSLLHGDTTHANAWRAVRHILADSGPEKVFVVLSPTCVGIVKNREKSKSVAELNRLLVQKEDPGNVRMVLTELDDKDGLLLAYVTANSFLQFNHIHVFGMKRAQDGMDLVKELQNACKLEGESGRSSRLQTVSDGSTSSLRPESVFSRESSTPGSTIDGEKPAKRRRSKPDDDQSSTTTASVYTVYHLGSAPVSSRAWWAKIDGPLITAREADKKTGDQRFASVEDFYVNKLIELGDASLAAVADASFGTEVALMVSDMKLELYRTLTQVLVRDILPTNIEEVRVVQLPSELSHDGPPEAQKSPGSSVAPGTPTTPTTPGAHVLPAVTTMSPEQRIAVMKTVAEGSISVDEAVEVVLETERENRVRPPDEMVLFSHRDPRLNTTIIEAILCSGASAQAMMDTIVQCRQAAEKRGFYTDPFAPVTHPTNSKSPAQAPNAAVASMLEYEIERDLLTAVEHLGNGEFGEVFLANQVVGSEEDEDGYIVDIEVKRAVKTLKPNAKKQYVELFVVEAKIHLGLQHPNIVLIEGVCMQAMPRLVVLEYCMYGDLQRVLQTCKSKEIELTAGEQAGLLTQVCSALDYLHGQRIVHMDLATRNILVAQRSVIKVADFGLAREYNEGKDHWLLRGKLRLPFLWIPPENLPNKMWDSEVDDYEPEFNQTTDVWAFGVLSWEVVSYGESPYEWKTKHNNLVALLEKVFKGLRVQVPDTTPVIIAETITMCQSDRAARPTFKQLIEIYDAIPGSTNEEMRDIGKLVNGQLEEQIEIMANEVSLMRRNSRMHLQAMAPPPEPGDSLGALSNAGQPGSPTNDQLRQLVLSPGSLRGRSPRHRRAASLGRGQMLGTPEEGDVALGSEDGVTPTRRSRQSVMFDPGAWALGPDGKMMRSPSRIGPASPGIVRQQSAPGSSPSPSLSKVVVNQVNHACQAGGTIVDGVVRRGGVVDGPGGTPSRPLTRRLSIRFVFDDDPTQAAAPSSSATDDAQDLEAEIPEAEGGPKAPVDDATVIGEPYIAGNPDMAPGAEPPLQMHRMSNVSIVVSEHDADELPAALPYTAAGDDENDDENEDEDGVAVPSIAARDATAEAATAATGPDSEQALEDVAVGRLGRQSSATFSQLSAQLSLDGMYDSDAHSDDEDASESPLDAPEGAGPWSQTIPDCAAATSVAASAGGDGAGPDSSAGPVPRRMTINFYSDDETEPSITVESSESSDDSEPSEALPSRSTQSAPALAGVAVDGEGDSPHRTPVVIDGIMLSSDDGDDDNDGNDGDGDGGEDGGAKPIVVPPTVPTIPAAPASAAADSAGDVTAAPKQSNLSRQKLRQTAVPEPQYDTAQNYKKDKNFAADTGDASAMVATAACPVDVEEGKNVPPPVAPTTEGSPLVATKKAPPPVAPKTGSPGVAKKAPKTGSPGVAKKAPMHACPPVAPKSKGSPLVVKKVPPPVAPKSKGSPLVAKEKAPPPVAPKTGSPLAARKKKSPPQVAPKTGSPLLARAAKDTTAAVAGTSALSKDTSSDGVVLEPLPSPASLPAVSKMTAAEIPAFPAPLLMRRSFGSEIGKAGGGRNSFVETVSPDEIPALVSDLPLDVPDTPVPALDGDDVGELTPTADTPGIPVAVRVFDGDDVGERTPTAAPSIDGPEEPAPDTTAELADSLMNSLPVPGRTGSRLPDGRDSRDSVSSIDSISSASSFLSAGDSETDPQRKASRRAARKARLEARLKADGVEKKKQADLEAAATHSREGTTTAKC